MSPSFCPQPLPNVDRILGIAAGKGGVGKSTVAFHLARAMSHLGVPVGLLDADIHGPSLPTLLGHHDTPQTTTDGKTLFPVQAQGIATMSMGFLVPPGKAAIWRGPMLHQALDQLLFRVNWGKLACLIIDLPPGTGDIPLTLSQKLVLEVLMVTTAQELALDDVRRGINMFRKMKVPLVGLLENMAFASCSHCGHETTLWQGQSTSQEAHHQGLPFLGHIPLDPLYQSPRDPLPPSSPFFTLARRLLSNPVSQPVREEGG